MIQITLNEREENYYICVNGHSKDKIVCASVSVLLETWRMAETALEKQEIIYEDGFIEASIPKSTISQVLYTHLCIGLSAIHRKYPKDISLNIGG